MFDIYNENRIFILFGFNGEEGDVALKAAPCYVYLNKTCLHHDSIVCIVQI